jgi:hypothetical protein
MREGYLRLGRRASKEAQAEQLAVVAAGPVATTLVEEAHVDVLLAEQAHLAVGLVHLHAHHRFLWADGAVEQELELLLRLLDRDARAGELPVNGHEHAPRRLEMLLVGSHEALGRDHAHADGARCCLE